MVRPRLAVLLPLASVIITSGLWLLARAQYLRLVCSPDGACHGWGGWSDYTPFSLLVAGMLNIPVATFGAPLYHLLQERTASSELIALLLGVAILWCYIGWVLDTRDNPPLLKGALRKIVGAAGCVFGIFLLVVTVPMFHVGLIYKAVALVWVLFIVRHFLLFFRNIRQDA